jgi:F-type H+-transporting ATPase subunit gamma
MRAITQTLQVTKAMNLISTAKLRKGRRLLEDTEPYFARIRKSMFDILSGAGTPRSEYIKAKDKNDSYHTAVVVITSDKGLAGGYNANVCRHAMKLCEKVKNPILVLCGAIGQRYFTQTPYLILENFSFRSQMPTVDNAKEIAYYLISQFGWGMFNEVHVVYTHMYSSIKLLPTTRQILPLDLGRMQEDFSREEGQKRVELRFEFLPSPDDVFDALVPLYIRGIMYGSLVEAYVSEQSARMAAMDDASKSAEKMLAALRLNYNRARQAGITQEMTEIISGSAAQR